MADAKDCLGHREREVRQDRIKKMSASPLEAPDENMRVLIKKGPVSEETSLRQLEDLFESTPEWKVIKDGGVLSVPVEEVRMLNPPKPDHSGQLDFGKRKGGGGRQIDSYPVGQTIANLNAIVLTKYKEVKEEAQKSGKSTDQAEREAAIEATKAPEFTAAKSWQDIEAEINLKKAVEKVMEDMKIPCVIIRSINLKDISALKELGLFLGDAEIDLILAYAAGDFLHVTICEVKRKDTYPWQTKSSPPNKQMVNSAEKQLTRDVEVLMALMADVPPSQIVLNTLACFPDTKSSLLKNTFCSVCLSKKIVCLEDVKNSALLRETIQIPDHHYSCNGSGIKLLLTLSARLLSHHSVLHVGYREIKDKESVATLRQRFNLMAVDNKMVQSQFIVASPQQQQAIAKFTFSSSERHLLLEGPAGTGKTLVAVQVANKLLESASRHAEPGRGPILVVTTNSEEEGEPILKYLNEQTGTTEGLTKMQKSSLFFLKEEFGCDPYSSKSRFLLRAMVERWVGRQILVLVDEIWDKETLAGLVDHVPENIRLILVLNPKIYMNKRYIQLQPSFLQVTLTTPYRSSRAITRLAQFMAKCYGVDFPESDFGNDVEGQKPIVIVTGRLQDETFWEALAHCRRLIGRSGTLLHPEPMVFNIPFQSIIDNTDIESICGDFKFHGWEADRVLAINQGNPNTIMEVITRARTHLCVILYGSDSGGSVSRTVRKYFEMAAEEGLIELFPNENKDITSVDWGTVD